MHREIMSFQSYCFVVGNRFEKGRIRSFAVNRKYLYRLEINAQIFKTPLLDKENRHEEYFTHGYKDRYCAKCIYLLVKPFPCRFLKIPEKEAFRKHVGKEENGVK